MQLPLTQLVRTVFIKSFPSKSLLSLRRIFITSNYSTAETNIEGPRSPFATPMANGKGRSKYRGYNSGQSRGSGTGKPKKPQLTHFLCFPLVNATSKPQLEESLRRFQNLISTPAPPNQSIPESKSQGNNGTTIPTSSQSNLEHVVNRPQLPAKAIRPLGTLHLTLGVMSLESEDRVQGAINLLRSLDPIQMIMDDIQQRQK